MAIGKNQSIGREYEARAAPATLARLTRTFPSASFRRLAARRAEHSLVHFNVHHRRTDLRNRSGNRARIGIEQGSVWSFADLGTQWLIGQTFIKPLRRRWLQRRL